MARTKMNTNFGGKTPLKAPRKTLKAELARYRPGTAALFDIHAFQNRDLMPHEYAKMAREYPVMFYEFMEKARQAEKARKLAEARQAEEARKAEQACKAAFAMTAHPRLGEHSNASVLPADIMKKILCM